MDSTRIDNQTPSALRRFIAEVAKLRAVAPIARRLRSRFSDTRFVTFPLGELGRLGNQLFQIAATIGIARRNGCSFVFPTGRTRDILNFPLRRLIRFGTCSAACRAAFGYEEIVIDRATELWGFFQSERYFAHCKDEVRHYFTPHHAVAQLLEQGFGRLLAGATCSVHVRRTDYLGDPTWPELAASDYYERAMSQFDSGTTFVIFSDDIEWCRERFRGRAMVFVEALSAVEDLFLMARCRGHIIANSSLSWWGAWLDPNPDKKVIAPARWFGGKHADPTSPIPDPAASADSTTPAISSHQTWIKI